MFMLFFETFTSYLLPTSEIELSYHQILPVLTPRAHESAASLLGAHAEGPYLQPTKHGAHEPTLFQEPSISLTSVYGPSLSNLKMVTLAPELELSSPLIGTLTSQSIRVSLGHTSATYEQGLTALGFGANCLTHTMNCMTPLHHRNPGLAGLITLPEAEDPKPPFFSILADGIHVHPTVAALLYRAAPQRAILISDSIELAGLPDGIYPGNAQIHGNQVKVGAVATMEGTDTLIGAVSTVNEGVKNLIKWSGCNVAEAVRCVTENVVDMMGVLDRGVLVEGRRGDFVVLDDEGTVLETWVAGKQVWRCEGREAYY
jgi:N-acetylglucosamine-6-phosphate deacetylase